MTRKQKRMLIRIVASGALFGAAAVLPLSGPFQEGDAQGLEQGGID